MPVVPLSRLWDLAPHDAQNPDRATPEGMLEVARPLVEHLLRRHANTERKISGPPNARLRGRQERVDAAAQFVKDAEHVLSQISFGSPDDTTLRGVIFECSDDIKKLASPASFPTDAVAEIGYNGELSRAMLRAVQAVQARLAQLERAASQATELDLAPQTEDARAFGNFLRLARRETKVPIDELTTKAGISDGYLRMLERGDKVASAETYKALLTTLGYRTGGDGAVLRVRDDDDRELRLQLLPATSKSDLVAARATATAEDAPGRSAEADLLREVLVMMLHAEPEVLRDIRNTLVHGMSRGSSRG